MSTAAPVVGSRPPAGYHANERPEMLGFVPRTARRVLDVGCGEGRFAAAVRARLGAEAWGIELDSEAALRAAARLDHLVAGDVRERIDELPNAHFDAICLNDVLEHLADPEGLLRRLGPKLATGGVVVASIPNVRFLPTLWDLAVRGEWRYADEGILDRTHLRFFTRRSIPRLFGESGYEVRRLEGINAKSFLKFRVVNWATLGRLADTRYLQFACVAALRRDGADTLERPHASPID